MRPDGDSKKYDEMNECRDCGCEIEGTQERCDDCDAELGFGD